MKIGFIGLGIMGRPMALNLKQARHQLLVPDKFKVPDDIAAVAEVAPDDATVAAKSEVVIIIVPDTPDVADVLFGEKGVVEGLKPGTLVIDMSSISPIATKEFAKKVNEKGCDYLDAPVSGGEVGAKQATLTIMVGGPEKAFAKAKPLFEVMGKNITHVGPNNGDGQTCKVANQIIVALNIQAVAEALVFAAKAGADPAKVRQALMGGFASSRILELHGERMIKGTFEPGFRIRLHQKDLNLAISAARALGVSPAEYRGRGADVQFLRGVGRGRAGSLGADHGDRGIGEFLDTRRGGREGVGPSFPALFRGSSPKERISVAPQLIMVRFGAFCRRLLPSAADTLLLRLAMSGGVLIQAPLRRVLIHFDRNGMGASGRVVTNPGDLPANLQAGMAAGNSKPVGAYFLRHIDRCIAADAGQLVMKVGVQRFEPVGKLHTQFSPSV